MSNKIVNLSVLPQEDVIITNNSYIVKDTHPNINYHDCVCVKPWGHEFLIYESNKIGIWYLKINKGQATSLHAHFKKDTFIIVMEGCAKLSLVNDELITLNKLESVLIPKNKFHGISSFSDTVYLMEIEIFDNSVNFTDKNDLIRINDQYNRNATGYETSIKKITNNIEDYGHFSLTAGFNQILFNNQIQVIEYTNENKHLFNDANYNILLSGEMLYNNTYIKEGSVIQNINNINGFSQNSLILTIKNKFSYEDTKIIYDNQQLNVLVKQLKSINKKIILTSGCYDILHVGHLSHLKQAKQLGDVLIVCLSSDEQIKKLKGDNRPINNYNDRINLFKTIQYVDYIVLYNEENIENETTLGNIIKIVDPFYWTKGSDYTKDTIIKKHPYIKNIELFENVEGKSTTNIINKINS